MTHLAIYTDKITKTTDKAIYSPNLGWIAKSQVKNYVFDAGYQQHIIILPEWLAKKLSTTYGTIRNEGIVFPFAPMIPKAQLRKAVY